MYTYRYPLGKIIETGGVDAYEYLNFLKHSIFLFIAISLINLTVLLPINASAHVRSLFNNFLTFQSQYEESDHSTYVTGLNSLYIGSIDERSSLLWAHLISVFVYTFLTWYTSYRIYSEVNPTASFSLITTEHRYEHRFDY